MSINRIFRILLIFFLFLGSLSLFAEKKSDKKKIKYPDYVFQPSQPAAYFEDGIDKALKNTEKKFPPKSLAEAKKLSPKEQEKISKLAIAGEQIELRALVLENDLEEATGCERGWYTGFYKLFWTLTIPLGEIRSALLFGNPSKYSASYKKLTQIMEQLKAYRKTKPKRLKKDVLKEFVKKNTARRKKEFLEMSVAQAKAEAMGNEELKKHGINPASVRRKDKIDESGDSDSSKKTEKKKKARKRVKNEE